MEIRRLSAKYNNTIITKQYSFDTKKDYWRITKSFFKWLHNDDATMFKGLSLGKRSKPKDLGNIITNEEMTKVLTACKSQRDRALLSLLHETGVRTGEILRLQIKDIIRIDKFMRIRVAGKTGERRVVVVSSVPYICRYLETHPDS